MVLVAEPGNNRLTAILILVIALLLIYLLCFHWFIVRHIEYGSDISDLSAQLGRYQRVASQQSLYEEKLANLQNRKTDENLFLDGNDFNQAAAEMSERLSQMVSTQAEDSCQIVSRQPVRPRVQERFEKVTVNARMRCSVEDLQKILHTLESSVPLVIVDEMTVIKPRARGRNRNNQAAQQSSLDIRFNMSGYLRQ